MSATINFQNLESQWQDQSDTVATALKRLVISIYASKTLRIAESDATGLYPELVSAKIIVKDGNVLGGMEHAINPSPLLLYGVVVSLPGYKDIGLPSGAAPTFEWLSKFILHFDDDHPKWGITEFLDRLAYFLLSHIRDQTGEEVFVMASRVLAADGRERFSALFSGYLQLFKEQPPASADLAWHLACHLGSEIGLPQGIDLSWSQLAETVGSYAYQNPDQAITIKDKALVVLTSASFEKLGVAWIVGLHLAGRIELDEIVGYFDSTGLEEPTLHLLMLVNLSTPGGGRVVLRALRAYLDRSEVISRELPGVVVRVLNSILPEDTALLSDCREILIKIIAQQNEALLQSTLIALGECQIHLTLVLEIAMKLLVTPGFAAVNVRGFDYFLARHRSSAVFFPIVKAYAMAVPLSRFQAFSNAIVLLRRAEPAEFDRQLMEMVIDDEGLIRWAGHQMLAMIQKQVIFAGLAFNPCSWEWKAQYRYCISLFEGFWEPENLVPLVIPLLASTNEIVLEVLSSKLEEYAEDYNVAVIEILEQKADLSIPCNAALVERLRLHLEEVNRRWTEKMAIKELHPQNTQSAMMRSFMNYYQKRSRKQMEKAYRETSIMAQVAQEVALSRGGGWRIGGNPEVQGLSTVSVSMRLPRRMFVRPEAYDVEFRNLFLQNWKQDYQQWEQTLSW